MSVKLAGKTISQLIAKKYPQYTKPRTILVGIPVGATEPDGTPTGQVAFWLERGTAHIKPRPVFRKVISEHSKDWSSDFKYILGQAKDLDAALEGLGSIIVGQVKEEINTISDPPNRPATIKKKGFDKPWIETGFLMQSIEYQIK